MRNILPSPSERNSVLFQANRWRLVDDGIQWILEVRKGRERAKATGWRARSFFLSRTALLRVVRETVGGLPQEAVRCIESLPARHPGPG